VNSLVIVLKCSFRQMQLNCNKLCEIHGACVGITIITISSNVSLANQNRISHTPGTHSHPLGICLGQICEIVHSTAFVHHLVFKIKKNSGIKLARDKIGSHINLKSKRKNLTFYFENVTVPKSKT